jgi:WhiB family redox-sensing transcriptional regulator
VITHVTTGRLKSTLSHTIDTDAVLPCGPDPELWFADTPAGVELAKSLCQPCPVRTECLAGAAARREPHGVWGGQLFINGQVVAHKRPRGRPRKAR